MVLPVHFDRYEKTFLGTKRPWLDLYGTRIRPITPLWTSREPEHSLLHRKLPDELLHEVFIRLPPYTLGRASCVCRKWRYALRNPLFWRVACQKSWQMFDKRMNESVLYQQYGGSWRKMWQLRPRLRYDGIYVSRNTYIRAGIAEWKITNPVHLVCYYRYLRFFPHGKFFYKNSSLKLKEVVKVMNKQSAKENVYGGRYTLTDAQVRAACVYPGQRPTVLRIQLRLRGTVPGANNRLDIVMLVTTGLNETEAYEDGDMRNIAEDWEDGAQNPDEAVTHKRGLAPFVFVPFEEVETSVLNLPVDMMDYYVPG